MFGKGRGNVTKLSPNQVKKRKSLNVIFLIISSEISRTICRDLGYYLSDNFSDLERPLD
jgi:hypothetical protein